MKVPRMAALRGVHRAYRDIAEVAAATEHAGLARRVAELQPLVCLKG